jgi:hypothetical protein
MLSGIFCVFVFAFLSDGKMTHLQAWTGVMVESMRARGGGELSHWVRHPLDVAASISPYGRRFPWEIIHIGWTYDTGAVLLGILLSR